MRNRGNDMIEINEDGPLGGQQQPAIRLRLIGLGQAGIGSLDQIVMYGLDQYDMLVVDTDQQTLDGSIVKEKLLLGADKTRGLGCGGDQELATEIMADCEEKMKPAVIGCDHLIVTLAFGGATASAAAIQLVREASKLNIRTIVIGTLPFEFESRRRQTLAARTIKQLRSMADAVLVFSTDRVTRLPQANGNVRQGFHVVNQLVGHGIESIAQILSKRGLIQLGFADIRSLFGCLPQGTVVENCWAGWGQIDSPREIGQLVSQAMDSPLLSPEVWEQADHAIVCLSGGKNLSLVQVQNILAELQKQLPENFSVATGATLEESCKDKLRLTILLARTKAPVEEVPIPEETAQTFVHDTVPLPNMAELQAKAQVQPEPEAEEESAPEESGETAAAESMLQPAPMAMRGKGTKADDLEFLVPRGKPKKYIAKQEELQFDGSHRGRFEKSIETIYEGENLDQPTFRRRKLAIRL
jgi:cell division protein FtsZ